MDSLANQTFFTVFARWDGEIRLFSVETALIQTEAEALEVVKDIGHAALVFRHDYDAPRRDVSEDIARLWLREIERDGNLRTGPLPEFVAAHLSVDGLVAA